MLFLLIELTGINSEQRLNYKDGFQCGIHVNNTRFCCGTGLSLVDFAVKRAYEPGSGNMI